MNWNEIFYYDGENLIRKISSQKNKKGEIVGFECKGYMRFYHQGKTYAVHRVVWEIVNGKMPDGYVIDHINHNTKDNRIESLRAVERVDNQRNLKRGLDNSSGTVGVYFHKKANKWMASIGFYGKQIYLGLYETKELAIQARLNKQKELNFHENHGGEYV